MEQTPSSISSKIWIIGSGSMALEYAKTLRRLQVCFEVIGRSEAKATQFEKDFNDSPSPSSLKVWRGGLSSFLDTQSFSSSSSHAIVAVGVSELMETSVFLIRFGISNLLIEKPGGHSKGELQKILKEGEERFGNQFQCRIAYNRRFLRSVRKAERWILEDFTTSTSTSASTLIPHLPPLISLHFEFNERALEVDRHPTIPLSNKQNWFIANSTHVVDLSLHFLNLNPFPTSSLPFPAYPPTTTTTTTPFPSPSPFLSFQTNFQKLIQTSEQHHVYGNVFSGSGLTTQRTIVSYQGNWISPGRWFLEMATPKTRLLLKPLEQLFVQRTPFGSFEEVKNDDEEEEEEVYLVSNSLPGPISPSAAPSVDEGILLGRGCFDKDSKPGLFLEILAFLVVSKHPDFVPRNPTESTTSWDLEIRSREKEKEVRTRLNVQKRLCSIQEQSEHFENVYERMLTTSSWKS